MSSAFAARREIYLRFVVGSEDEPAQRLDGLFVVSGALRDEGTWPESANERLEEFYTWFNAHLPCPPYSRGEFSADAICWFRPAASRCIQRMWDFAALLREFGQRVRVLETERPGKILYRDRYQVVAVPRARSLHKRTGVSSFQDLGAPRPLRWTKRDRARGRRGLGGAKGCATFTMARAV